MRAVVEAPHARRLVLRARDDVFAVGSDADREHRTAVPPERAHLRASGEGATHARAVRACNVILSPDAVQSKSGEERRQREEIRGRGKSYIKSKQELHQVKKAISKQQGVKENT
eukprot:2546382-Pleurochrysis_carterae.AAC.1